MKQNKPGKASKPQPAGDYRMTVVIPNSQREKLQAIAKGMGLDLSNFVRLTLYATIPKDEQAV